MKILKQTNKTNCGQTCVAMITNKCISCIEEMLGHSGITEEKEIIDILKLLNKKCLEFYGQIRYRNRKIIKSRTYLCLHKNPKKDNQKHWTICYSGNIIDPAGREEKDIWPMIKYWIIINE